MHFLVTYHGAMRAGRAAGGGGGGFWYVLSHVCTWKSSLRCFCLHQGARVQGVRVRGGEGYTRRFIAGTHINKGAYINTAWLRCWLSRSMPHGCLTLAPLCGYGSAGIYYVSQCATIRATTDGWSAGRRKEGKVSQHCLAQRHTVKSSATRGHHARGCETTEKKT